MEIMTTKKTNKTKQTAVEWLVQQLQKTRDWQRVINEANQSGSSVRDVVQQAKEMEKEQKRKDFTDGWIMGNKPLNDDVIDKWYNQTYGGNK
jgi:hypothetical protein